MVQRAEVKVSEVNIEEASSPKGAGRKRPALSPKFGKDRVMLALPMSSMSPNRSDTFRGLYIPIWLLALRLSPDAMLTWAAMARLAGRSRRLRDATHERIGSITGMSKDETRRAIQALEKAGLLTSHHRPGRPSDYAFRGPRADQFTWKRFMFLVDSDSPSPDPWRPW